MPALAKCGEAQGVDRLDLHAQRVVDRAEPAVHGARLKVVSHQHVQAVALQHQADPAQVLFAAKVVHRERHPEVGAGGHGPAQGGHHRFDFGEFVLRGRLAGIEEILLCHHRALAGRLLVEIEVPDGLPVPQDDDGVAGVDRLRHAPPYVVWRFRW
jgi:hypothetical protein